MAMSARPLRSPARRGHLRVIPGGRGSQRTKTSRRARRRASIRFTAFAFLIVGSLIFSLVILNIMAAGASFRLEELRRKTAAQEAAYRGMRYEVAVRESPEKIKGVAERLGLVIPQRQEYLIGPARPSVVATSEPELDREELEALIKKP